MLNTPITPPRVPLIDQRTGLIDRAWYMFFLSLNNITSSIDPNADVGPDSGALIAGATAAIQALSQEIGTLPTVVDSSADLQAQIEAVDVANLSASLLAQLAEQQKQIEALQVQPLPTPAIEPALTWITLVSRPSTLAGTATVSGVAGDVRLHTKTGKDDVYRFIPSTSDPLLDAFYTTFSGSVLSGFITARG